MRKVDCRMHMDKEHHDYLAPNRDSNVWPNDICPGYTPRDGAIESIKGCWYCRYADFHLKELKALDVGVCCWPTKQI